MNRALIAILAQMGSFVPAVGASIGIIDRVFSRVGASDDIAKPVNTDQLLSLMRVWLFR